MDKHLSPSWRFVEDRPGGQSLLTNFTITQCSVEQETRAATGEDRHGVMMSIEWCSPKDKGSRPKSKSHIRSMSLIHEVP